MCCDTSSETHVQRGEQTYTSASLAWGLHLASSGLSSVTAVGMSWERNTSHYRRSYLPRGSTKVRSHFFPCSVFPKTGPHRYSHLCKHTAPYRCRSHSGGHQVVIEQNRGTVLFSKGRVPSLTHSEYQPQTKTNQSLFPNSCFLTV